MHPSIAAVCAMPVPRPLFPLPDRVKPRNVFNLGIGSDNPSHSEKKRHFTGSLEIENLLDKVALYNFLSTFSGTDFLEPRAVAARVGFVF